MPELPEVETIRQGMEPLVVGKTIVRARLRLKRILLGISQSRFEKNLNGQTVRGLVRRGKYLLIQLDNKAFIVHLGMTGQFMYSPEIKNRKIQYKRSVAGLPLFQGETGIDKHTHLILELNDGGCLLFRDIRTFGKIIHVSLENWLDHPRIAKLGPEPLELSPRKFIEKIWPIKNRKVIKALLLEQTFIAGVGNIYADEALFDANIHPETLALELPKTGWIQLIQSVQKVLKKGIKNRGTSFSDYRNADGSKGTNQENLKVYGRGGLPCLKCKTELVKTEIAQRGTVFCPKCQKVF